MLRHFWIMKTIKNQNLKIMKKLKVFVVVGVLMFGMSSCVYSLFPIYTEDTLVFLPELLGTWRQDPDYPDDVITFEAMSDKKKLELGLMEPEPEPETVRASKLFQIGKDNIKEDTSYAYVLTGANWSIKSDNQITAKVDGERVSDPELVIAHYNDLFKDVISGQASISESENLENVLSKVQDTIDAEALGKKLNKLDEGLKKLGEGLDKLGKAINSAATKFKGTSYVSFEESYKVTVVEEGVPTEYLGHIAQIGDDYFLDMYPLTEYSSGTFSGHYFPVHTFYKVELVNGKLNLVFFDMEKLKELFESNLIRLRHEYVNEKVLITAQPKEIQKFLDKYSDDETVFHDHDTVEEDYFEKIGE